ncbi:MAG: autotransporter domain-containing protein [Novosphingobium sp.]|nr:autotransporter domain-containing protein [Novosphingobium sp.]
MAGISIYALSVSQSAMAQTVCGDGSPGPVCQIDNAGALGSIVGTTGTATVINNSGTITGTPAISQGGSVVLVVDNQAGGVIDGDGGNAIEGQQKINFSVHNAGTINGDVVFDDVLLAPPMFGGGSIVSYISDGGTLNGDLQLGQANGYSSAAFFQRGADDGVTGTISAGSGVDIYFKSYSTTQSVALGQYVLPATFEVEGYEVLGSGTTLTLTGSGVTTLFAGDGHVVNDATIGLLDTSGLYPAGVTVVPSAIGYYQPYAALYRREQIPLGQANSFLVVPYGNALASFTNNGVVNGDIILATASFTNNGTINLASNGPGTAITSAAGQPFLFSNSGSIVMSDNGARPAHVAMLAEFFEGTDYAVRLQTAIDETAPQQVNITNLASGTISGGLSFSGVASEFAFVNDGTISIGDNPFEIDRAVQINLGGFSAALDPAFQEDVVADSVSIVNTGTLDGGLEADVTTHAFTFNNSGNINADTSDPYAEALNLSTDDWPDTPGGEDVNEADTFDFLNSGTITGSVELEADATLVTITNSGSITQALRPGHTAYVNPEAADTLSLEQETTLDGEVVFTNTGTISNADLGGGAVLIDLEAGSLSSGIPEAANANGTVTVTNSGSIVASGGSYLTAPPYNGLPAGQVQVDFAIALGIGVDAEGTGSVTITNQAGGVIDARGTPHLGDPAGPQALDPGAALAVAVAADEVTFTNEGTLYGAAGGSLVTPANVLLVPIGMDGLDFEGVIGGAIDTFGSVDTITNGSGGVINGGIALRQGNDTLTNEGTITGNIFLGSGDDLIENYGTVDGDLDLGDGNDIFIQAWDATFTGTADGGAGTDTFVLDLDGSTANDTVDLAIYDQLVNFEVLETRGTGGGVSGGSGDDNVNNTGTLNGPVDLGEGDNQFTNASGGTINNDVTAGSGSDTVSNEGTINGSVDLGDGDNQFTNASGGTIAGDVQTGTGNDSLQNQGTIEGDIVLDGESTPAPVQTLALMAVTPAPTGGDDVLTNEGDVTGSIYAGGGNDKLTNSGSVGGDIDLGDGDDELILEGDWAIGGNVIGGEGTDAVKVTFADATSEDDLPVLDLSGFDGVEQFEVNGGTGKIGGEATFEEVNVNSGRLIGAADSVITGDVNVGSGGTFGSAGTVAGDISVASGGTLSPGASPAVMTVIGDVSLASGSITTFEFVPAPGQSDQLLIDGNLTIASGAVLNLTGDRPLTPGTPYDMIVADSIDGEFTIGTWDKSAVQGFLRYVDGATSDQLQLVGTFVAPAGTGPQAIAAVNYVNSLLISGEVSSALLDAIPVLLDSDGYASATAFGLLSPEPYATASQLGVEHGLSLSKTMRSGTASSPHDEARLFAFADGFGNWRSLKSNADLGTSRARSDGYGLLGGLGFGSRNGSIAAFVGYVDSQQRIRALGARTDADGMVAGLHGQLAAGGFNLAATIAYDWSDAQTDRAVPGNGAVSSSGYDLNSLVLDATIGYSLPIGGDWTLQPQAGLTHVSTKRGATSETGSAAFSLDIEKERAKATFADAAVVLRGGQNEDATFEPWIQLGVRQQLDGKHVSATAGFVGMPGTFTVFGAPRKATVMTAGAGFSARLADGVKVFASYQGEFGGGTGTQVGGGVQIAF